VSSSAPDALFTDVRKYTCQPDLVTVKLILSEGNKSLALANSALAHPQRCCAEPACCSPLPRTKWTPLPLPRGIAADLGLSPHGDCHSGGMLNVNQSGFGLLKNLFKLKYLKATLKLFYTLYHVWLPTVFM